MARRVPPVQDTVQEILRVRKLEEELSGEIQRELIMVRGFLEKLVGPTVSMSDAARALGVSRAALTRWLEKGDLPAVTTPSGRREIPLSELIELCRGVADRATGSSRPIARVMRERERAAEEAIDIDRLLPRRKGRGHRTAELHSLAYHRLVAERLDESVVERAKVRLDRWIEGGRVHPQWAAEWKRVLGLPVPQIARTIRADTPRARELRQTSPFAGLLTAQERRRLRQAVEDRAAT